MKASILKPITVTVLSLVLLAACGKTAPAHPDVVAPEGDVVTIPLAEVKDGQVHFYTFKDERKNINFFVRTDGEGALHTCFDACYTCYKALKGYAIDGPEIYCRECGMGFKLEDEQWESAMGCMPVDLPHTVEDDTMVIKTADLKKGGRLF